MSKQGQDHSTRLEWTRRVIDFLTTIGVEVVEMQDQQEADCFLPAIIIKAGVLHVDVAKVIPGDILHEAGHLCVLPREFWPHASGNLKGLFDAAMAHMDDHKSGLMEYPECPVCRAGMQSSDVEATAWQYAAAQHIDLPDELLWGADAFGGKGEDIKFALRMGSYFGINGLQASGFTSARKRMGQPNTAVYPKLNFWVHPGRGE